MDIKRFNIFRKKESGKFTLIGFPPPEVAIYGDYFLLIMNGFTAFKSISTTTYRKYRSAKCFVGSNVNLSEVVYFSNMSKALHELHHIQKTQSSYRWEIISEENLKLKVETNKYNL